MFRFINLLRVTHLNLKYFSINYREITLLSLAAIQVLTALNRLAFLYVKKENILIEILFNIPVMFKFSNDKNIHFHLKN